MSIKTAAERISLGQELNRIDTNARAIIEQLKTLKANILAVKNKVQNDQTLYSVEDIAEVDAVIAALGTEINTI